MIKDIKSQHIELHSVPDEIVKVEKIVEKVCDEYNITNDFYGNMLIAVTEAFNNAVIHGNKANPSKHISLDLNYLENEVEISVKDEGAGFNFNEIPDPTTPENITKLNGRGVFLMKTLADDVEFEDNGSKVNLTFNISAN